MREAISNAGGRSAAQLADAARARFLNRTYGHLFAAIAGFVLFEVMLFETGVAARITGVMLGTSWLLWLGAFMVVGWLATRAAHRSASLSTQYLALSGYVVAQGLLFVPLLYIAREQFPGAIEKAAYTTVIAFAVLTAIVAQSGKDFSFLGTALKWGGLCAVGLIVLGALFGFNLGVFFVVAMIAFAGAAILYDTSNVLHHFPEDRYVAGALQLFASIALLFWYVLRLFMSRD
jgi:uncharacterized protein